MLTKRSGRVWGIQGVLSHYCFLLDCGEGSWLKTLFSCSLRTSLVVKTLIVFSERRMKPMFEMRWPKDFYECKERMMNPTQEKQKAQQCSSPTQQPDGASGKCRLGCVHTHRSQSREQRSIFCHRLHHRAHNHLINTVTTTVLTILIVTIIKVGTIVSRSPPSSW